MRSLQGHPQGRVLTPSWGCAMGVLGTLCGGMDDVWFEVEASSSGGSVGTSWSAEVGVTWHCGGQGVRDGHMGVVASFRAMS